MSIQQLPLAVVAGGEINGLGVVRSLALGNVPVLVLDTDLSRPTLRTRFAQKRQVSSLEGNAFIEILTDLRRTRTEKPVLFLTQEKSVDAVSKDFERISHLYRISMPSRFVMETLMDKAKFQEAAQAMGFPIPRAVTLRDPNDLEQARQLCYPCVLKPIVKSSDYDRCFKKAYTVASPDEAEAICNKINDFAVMILQEWIEGGDDSIYFCLQYRSREQGPLASFVGRKLRSWPPHIGGTASCVPAIEVAPALEDLTNEFFTQIGFFGMGSVEYKKDARTGKFLMIEPTVGRTDFQEEIATLNGVNIPLAAYQHESGTRLTTFVEKHRPAAWIVSQLDRWSAELQHQSPKIGLGIRRYDAIARLSDPLPWFFSMAERVAERLRPSQGQTS